MDKQWRNPNTSLSVANPIADMGKSRINLQSAYCMTYGEWNSEIDMHILPNRIT